MNKNKLIAAIILYLLGGPVGALPEGTPRQEAVVREPTYSRLALESELNLNNGQRWEVDKAMMLHLRQMEKELKNYRGSQPEDYQRLGKSLKVTLGKLVAGCTMQGAAHDELHKWLVPFMEKVDALNGEHDQDVLREQVVELKDSFELFNTYFQ